jgi:glutathione S-transferase
VNPSKDAVGVEAPPHLLHFKISHYNEKVRWALDYKRWPHTREALIPGFHVFRTRRLTGQQKLPILVLDGVPMLDSAKILAEIEKRRPDPPLFSDDPAERERADELQAFFDGEVAPALRRLVWSCYLDRPRDCARLATMGDAGFATTMFRILLPLIRPAMRGNLGVDRERLAAARQNLPRFVDRLESEIGEHGYLVGDRFTVADLAVAAVMSAILRPPEFPYPLPEPWAPELVDLRESISERTGCRWVIDIYRRHRGTSAELSVS